MERLREEPGVQIGFLPINPRLPGVLRKLQAIKYVRTIVTSAVYVASLLGRVWRYDVIHIFSASYSSFVIAPTPAIIVGKLFRRKLLLNYHGGAAFDHLQRWRRSAIPIIKLVDEVAVPSEFLVRVFAQFGFRTKPIYNLVELEKFPFRKRQPLRPYFLSNRNFETHYGVDRVLRAFAIIQQHVPEARLIVAGDGPERTALEELARELHLKNTEFKGKVSPESVVELYQATDIFLNGSEIDNQPLSIIEAFACGLAVVTTDAGGIPDMVTAERTGLIVPMGAYQELAACALRLLDDPVLAQSLIAEGRQECKKYQWRVVREQWLNVYYDLVHSRTPGLCLENAEAGSRNIE
jgi:glycosyltransferase involved in cell wall biosynthesis